MRHRPIDKPDGTFCQDCGAELRNVDDLRADCPSRLSDEPLDPATEEWVNVIRNRPMPSEHRDSEDHLRKLLASAGVIFAALLLDDERAKQEGTKGLIAPAIVREMRELEREIREALGLGEERT